MATNNEKMLNTQGVYDLVKEYFIVLPVDEDIVHNHKRQIRRIVAKVYEANGEPPKAPKKPLSIPESEAREIVMHNPDIRKYFLGYMEGTKKQVKEHFAQMDEELNRRNVKALQDDSTQADINYDVENADAEERSVQQTRDMYRFLINAMFPCKTFEDLCKMLEIDCDKYREAYLLWLELKSGDEPFPILNGFSEIDYKLRRPTIYFHI